MLARAITGVMLLVVPLLAARAQSLSPSEVFEAAAPSVVVVKGLDQDGNPIMLGSGVVVSHGRVVTNCHVISTADSAVVISGDTKLPASLQFADPDRDLCSFLVPRLLAPAAKIGVSARLKVGAKVFAIGAPRGYELTLSDGLLSSLRTVAGGSILQITAPISPGSSGGGLFDDHGRLIGITTMYLADSQQINFAVPAEWIGQLPARNDVRALEQARQEQVIERATQQLADFDAYLTVNDSTYSKKRPELDRAVREIRQRLPPSQWLDAAAKVYQSIEVSRPLKPRDTTSEIVGRWEFVIQNDGAATYVDRRSLRRDGDLVHVWLRFDFTPPTRDPKGRLVAKSLTEQTYDCANRTELTTSGVSYAPDGSVVAKATGSKFTIFPPETLGEVILEAVCK